MNLLFKMTIDYLRTMTTFKPIECRKSIFGPSAMNVLSVIHRRAIVLDAELRVVVLKCTFT